MKADKGYLKTNRIGVAVDEETDRSLYMKEFSSIFDLINQLDFLDPSEWIYVNKYEWINNPKEAHYFYIPEEYINSLNDNDIYLDEDDMEMPRCVQNMNLESLITIYPIKEILKIENNNVDKMIKEVNFYLENNCFSY